MKTEEGKANRENNAVERRKSTIRYVYMRMSLLYYYSRTLYMYNVCERVACEVCGAARARVIW